MEAQEGEMNELSKSLLRMSAQIYKLEKFKDDALEELITRAVRQISNEVIGKKPEVQVMINRLVAG